MEASALHGPAVAVRPPARPRVLRLRSDDQLLVLFRRGSDEAFSVLVDRYRSRLLAYTRRMLGGSQQDAEDALQDVFLRAYGSLRADERPVSVRAWLYRVAHNRCVDQIRRTGPAPEDIFAVSRGTSLDPADACERREDLRQVVADIGQLPENQRSALLLREIDGLTYNELAATLDLSLPAVKSVLVRARTSLAEAGEARSAPCAAIRMDLDAAHDAGVRPEARSRRHMRECDPCRDYQTAIAGSTAVHSPAGPLGFLAKLLGIGGAPVGGGAAFGGVAGGKVAALLCCGMVAVGAGAAAELPRQVRDGSAIHSLRTGHAPSEHALKRALHLAPAASVAGHGAATSPVTKGAGAPARTPASGTAHLRSGSVGTPTTTHDTSGTVTSDPVTSPGDTVTEQPTTPSGPIGSSVGSDGRDTATDPTDPSMPAGPVTSDPPPDDPVSTPSGVDSNGRPTATASSVPGSGDAPAGP